MGSYEGEVLNVTWHVLNIIPWYILNLASPVLPILEVFKPLGLQNYHIVGFLQVLYVSLQSVKVILGDSVLERGKSLGNPYHLFVHAETHVE